jgi:hypothetical protein
MTTDFLVVTFKTSKCTSLKNTYYNLKVVTWDNHVSILDPLHSGGRLPSHLTFKYDVHGLVSIYTGRSFQEFRLGFKIEWKLRYQ